MLEHPLFVREHRALTQPCSKWLKELKTNIEKKFVILIYY